ncbi:MAG: outer membrane lipoprotein carrier protein LolA [Spirochaetes bacterium]|nr:MAG: outer membrane lipoprotein carrier protein LolA [Spirochaetota bacterium]
MNKRIFFITVLLTTILIRPPLFFTQELVTAEKYLNDLSKAYGEINDYKADITITQGDSVMKGVLFYKKPNLLRINFTKPKDQVLVVNGESLIIYIPEHSVIMKQNLRRRGQETLASLASKEGLTQLKRNYSVAYEIGPEPVPLDEQSKLNVIKLKFEWRSPDEAFRQLNISVTEDRLIRRIIGVTRNYEEIQFDFTNIDINQNIPDARFTNYEPPPDANVFDNFLFKPEN